MVAQKFSCAWTLTDPDTKQWGRQTSENIFEFKYTVHGEVVEIDLEKYTDGEVEDAINTYGYTLYDPTDALENVATLYGTRADWIIAECIFELEN